MWSSKKPQNLQEYGKHHTHQRNQIVKWLKGFKRSAPVLVISGPANIGKTTLLNLILKQHNYTPLTVCTSDCFSKNLPTVKESIKNVLHKNSVGQYFTTQKHCIVIDDYESSHTGVQNLMKFLGSGKLKLKTPLFVCTQEPNCTIPQILRKQTVKMPYLQPLQIVEFLKSILKREKIKIENDGTLWQIAKTVKNTFDAIDILYNAYNQNVLESFDKMSSFLKSKSERDKIFSDNKYLLIKKLISEKDTLTQDEKVVIWSQDYSHVSQVLFENAPIKNLEKHAHVLESFLIGKECEACIYSHQQWDMYQYMENMDISLLNMYDGIPMGFNPIPKTNSKSCQHFYQLKSQQAIHFKFGKSDTKTYQMCDVILHNVLKNKKGRKKFIEKHGLTPANINAVKRLSLTKYPKIKF